MTPRLRATVAATLIGLILSACGDSDSGSSNAAHGASTVRLQNLEFKPKTISVDPGTTVQWMWADGSIQHDVAGDGFKSDVKTSGSFSHRFEEPGRYDYKCTLHPAMKGTVEVKTPEE